MSTTAMNGSSMPPKRFGWWKRKRPVSCSSFSFSGSSTRASSHFCARSRSVGTISPARRIASSYGTPAKLICFVPLAKNVALTPFSILRRAFVLARGATLRRHELDCRRHASRGGKAAAQKRQVAVLLVEHTPSIPFCRREMHVEVPDIRHAALRHFEGERR